MPEPTLNPALMRILVDAVSPRRAVGAGFLVSDRHVLTCAHVVEQALGLSSPSPSVPTDAVWLDLPLVPGAAPLKGKPIVWHPVKEGTMLGEIEDIAVLELQVPLPGGAQPAPIVVLKGNAVFDRAVRLCGFPEGMDEGDYVSGQLQGLIANGWVQLDPELGRRGVAPGFSGTAVWDKQEHAVAGMIVSVQSRDGVPSAYMIPMATLIAAWPELDTCSRPPNPYRGLNAFREEDAPYFFGRDGDIRDLVEAVQQHPLVAVVGASGSGKSSLVLAGLVPHLRTQDRWLIARFRPRGDPFGELATALAPLLYPNLDKQERREKRNDILAKLNDGRLSVADEVAILAEENPGKRLLLIADQFEELYTQNLREDRQHRQHRFIDALLATINVPDSACNLLLTLRGDFVGRALGYGPFVKALDAHSKKILGPMNEDALRAAIEGPAERLGVKLEPGLAERILQDLGHEPGNLPLLEFALTQLWERQSFRQLTHGAYEVIGGVNQALARHADRVYADLEEDQARLRRIFVQLVRPGEGTEDTRQVATREEVGIDNWDLVVKLADHRLVVTGRNEETGLETVEVVHEALIHGWNQLRDWIEVNRDILRTRERIRVRMRAWQDDGMPEDRLLAAGRELEEGRQLLTDAGEVPIDDVSAYVERSIARERRRRQHRIGGIAMVFAVLAVALTFALVQWQESIQQTRNALQRTLDANYHLAKFYEEKALKTLSEAENSGSSDLYQEAWLYALEAALQEIPEGETALDIGTVGHLLDANLIRNAFYEHWVSPVLNLGTAQGTGIGSVAFSPDGRLLASGPGSAPGHIAPGDDFPVRVWDTENGSLVHTLTGHKQKINELAFSSSGHLLASASADNTITLWDPAPGKYLFKMGGNHRDHRFSYTDIAFSPDDRTLASGSTHDKVQFWDLTRLKRLEPPEPGAQVVRAPDSHFSLPDPPALPSEFYGPMLEIESGSRIDFSTDGRVLAVASGDSVHLHDAASGKHMRTLHAEDGGNRVYDVTFSPDGRLLAAAPANKVHLWSTGNSDLIHTLNHPKVVHDIAFSPDSRFLVSGGLDGALRFWDVGSGALLRTGRAHHSGSTGGINSIAYKPDGASVATGSSDGTVRLWHAQNLVPIGSAENHWGSVNSVAFSPDGRTLASASDDRSVRVWNTETGKLIHTLEGHQNWVAAAAYSPDGRLIASASGDGTIGLWDTASGERIHTFSAQTERLRVVAYSPLGDTLASASWQDSVVRVWDAQSGAAVYSLEAPGVTELAYAPDGRLLASASNDHTVRLWDMATGRLVRTLEDHEGPVLSVAFSPDGLQLASGGGMDDYSLRLWETDTGRLIRTLDNTGHVIKSLAYSPDGRLVAVPHGTGVHLWDIGSGRLAREFDIDCRWPDSIAFSSQNHTLAVGCRDKTVRLLDGATVIKLEGRDGKDGEMENVAFSSDGRLLATWGLVRNEVRIWDARSGRLIRTLPVRGTFTKGVAFSPDGRVLAIYAEGNTFNIWDPASGERLQNLTGNGVALSPDEIVLSPDGRRLVTLDPSNRTLRIWDINSGELIRTLAGHDGGIDHYAFSPDGKTIASSSARTVRLWNIEDGKALFTFDVGASRVAFSPNGRMLAAAGGEMLHLWDTGSGERLHSLDHGDWRVRKFLFSPDGRGLATLAGGDTKVRFWDARTGRLIHSLEIGHNQIFDLAFFPNSTLLAVGVYPLQIWDTATGQLVRTMEDASPTDFAFSSDGLRLAFWGGYGTSVRIRDAQSGQPVMDLQAPGGEESVRMWTAGFGPDGHMLAAGSEDGIVHLWDLKSGKLSHSLAGHGGLVSSVAFAPQGDKLISVSRERLVQLWDLDTGRLAHNLTGHGIGRGGSELQNIAISPDGGLLASTDWDGKTIELWDVNSGTLWQTLRGHEWGVRQVAFSPNGRLVASAASDYTVRLWNPQNGTVVHVLEDGEQSADTIEFSPDGRMLASTSYAKGKVRLWDIESGTLLRRFEGHTPIAFSPGGGLLAAGSTDDTVRLWDPQTGTLVHVLEGSGLERIIDFSPDGRIAATATRAHVHLWNTASGEKLRTLERNGPITFSPDGRILAVGLYNESQGNANIRLWPLDPRVLDLFSAPVEQRKILQGLKTAAEFLWQRKVTGRQVVEAPRTLRLFPRNGYFFEHDDRLRPLLDPPGPSQSKFDQVYEWAVENAGL